MEGDLTLEEFNEALLMHMNGNSSPRMDGFTVNYLRTFWPQMKYLTKDALNAIQKDGQTQTLRSVILKLLRNREKTFGDCELQTNKPAIYLLQTAQLLYYLKD